MKSFVERHTGLRAYLKKMGLEGVEEFEIAEADYQKHLSDTTKFHPNASKVEQLEFHTIALANAIWHKYSEVTKRLEVQQVELTRMQFQQSILKMGRWLLTGLGILAALLLLQILLSVKAHAQVDCVQFWHSGGSSAFKNYCAPFKMIEGSSVTFSVDGSNRLVITSASTAATAFSALTASTNTNAGVFAASGNSWDFTATTLMKLRVASGLTTSANGDLGYDSSAAARWHIWVNGGDKLLIAATNVGTAGQMCGSNTDGTCTFSDPIVSGPDAVAAAPTKNPVQVGCLFLTTPATLTNNQVGAVQCDATQNILVKVVSAPSTAVTNGGTFAVQATLQTQTDATMIGGVNVKEINGVAPLMGNGTTGAGSQRVTIASDNTAFAVNAAATLAAETTKVIGTVRNLGNAGGVFDAVGQNAAAPANWLSIGCDFFTAPTTITTGNGSNLECDSAGNLFVNLKTALPAGSNVIGHVITDANSVTNATLNAETTKVIGTVRVLGNVGAILDAVIGAAAPPNVLAIGFKDIAGNAQAGLSDTNGRQFIKQYPDTTTTSYRASKKFAASSTTDNAVMPGNATNTVLVTKILVTCNQTTAGQINVELLKRSVADTVGTSAAMTAVPMDSSYAAAVSAPLSYTGTGPTVGTAVGDLDNLQIGCMAPATATPNDIFVFRPEKPIVLRGTAQQIAVNVGNAALTGGNITVTFEWDETTTP